MQEAFVLKRFNKVLPIAFLSVSSLFLLGCPQRTSIGWINREPGRYAGKEVTVAGRVMNSYGVMGTGVFELEDGSGHLWIFSERGGVPGRGTEVAVTGRVEEGLNIGGRSFAMALRETRKRHYRD
jgi:hypothetical protein